MKIEGVADSTGKPNENSGFNPEISAIKANSNSKTLLISKNCVVLKIAQRNMLLHNHCCIEMVYILEGTVKHHIEKDGKVYDYRSLGAGNFIFIDYNTYHDFKDASPDFRLINFLFTSSLIGDFPAEACTLEEICRHPDIDFDFSALRSSPINNVFFDNDRQILAMFEKACTVYKKELPGYKQLLRCLAIEVIITTLQQLLPDNTSKVKHKAVREICKYIDCNYMENITLSKFCQDQYFNLNYISKKFKETTGMTFNLYLQQVRMHNACGLLIESDYSVSTIAEMVGYSDVSFFRVIFKKIMGTTPTEFKKLYNGQGQAPE